MKKITRIIFTLLSIIPIIIWIALLFINNIKEIIFAITTILMIYQLLFCIIITEDIKKLNEELKK